MSSSQMEIAVGCPDLEELAAFVDGQVTDESRRTIVEHLASCEDCYEVYAETLRIREDLAAQEEPSEPAPVLVHPRSWTARWAKPLAAAAVLVVAIGAATWFWPRPSLPEIAASSALDGVDWTDNGLPMFRGPSSNSALDPSWAKPSFRIGVFFVDLETALRREDHDKALDQVSGIRNELENLSLAFIGESVPEELRGQIEGDAPSEQLLLQAQRLGELLSASVDADAFELGKWSETARLAALTGRLEHFHRREFKSSFRRIRKQEHPERVTRLLGDVKDVLKGDRVEAEELTKIFTHLNRIEGVR